MPTLAPPRPPAEIAHLVDLIGADATLTLIEAHGGTRVFVPKQANQGTKLARLLGLPAARALSGWHGGGEVRIPLARAWRVQLYQSQGDSYARIARRLGCTESTVWRILRDTGRTAQQPDLFGAG